MSSLTNVSNVQRSDEPLLDAQKNAVNEICLDLAIRLNKELEPIFADLRNQPHKYSSMSIPAKALDIVRKYKRQLDDNLKTVVGPAFSHNFPKAREFVARLNGLSDEMSRIHESVNGNLSRTNTGSLSDSSEPSQC
jgi:hypothetical protein